VIIFRLSNYGCLFFLFLAGDSDVEGELEDGLIKNLFGRFDTLREVSVMLESWEIKEELTELCESLLLLD